ncbi:MAG: uracil-DNA glycosylase [Candidatus Parcubacteria bacterium]|nr:uracil-DNA glycosylase [Candidatus Parcubacteria bacterium]
MNKEKELKRIAEAIKKCKKCILWKTRNNTVPGEGPANARIIAIGQAPGANEDMTGRPFIGRAGKLLTQLLEMAGMDRKKVFITSPVKCFPPKNRKPTKKEVFLCLPYLKNQIKIINPQKIILLGEVAFKLFFPEKRMKDFRGKWLIQDNKNYFISYHPAAGIRFQKFKKILEKDFKKLR